VKALLYRLRMALMANPVTARLARTAFALRSALLSPPFVPPGHWASPLTAPPDVERAQAWRGREPAGVDLAEERQLELARAIAPTLGEPFTGPRSSTGPENTMYLGADAAVYRAMLRHLRPARVLEVGSGYSTAIALDTAEQHLPGLDLSCIEPYPDRLLAALEPGDEARIGLERAMVQDVPLERYDALGDGDVLFIDSSHVVKPGSDVVWLYLHVLPRLAPGVVVHVHDIFWPFEYPAHWLAERRDWTEIYLLQALLAGSSQWEVVLFSSWLWDRQPDLVPASLRDLDPGSIWLRRRTA
jgi:predicted O-methyltransferase YrrM